MISQVDFDRRDTSGDVVAKPLIAVEYGEPPARSAAIGRNLDKAIARASRAAGGDVGDRGYANDFAIRPVCRRAVLKIIDLTDDNGVSWPNEKKKRE